MRNLSFISILIFGISFITGCNQDKVQEEQTLQTDSLITQAIKQVKKKSSKFKGYLCTGDNEYSPFTYTRDYKQDGDKYVTLYKIYSIDNGYYLNITATHLKSLKKISISIDDITVSKEFGHISSQKITYAEPSLKMFGRENIFKSRGMDEQGRLPNDLGLRFASDKFENINVVNIVKDDQENSTKWYILDD